MKIQFHYKRDGVRANLVVRAFTQGFRDTKDTVVESGGDVHIFYGMSPSNMARMSGAGHYFVVDLGYWERGHPNDNSAFYKVCYRSHHPDNYFENLPKTNPRFVAARKTIKRWAVSAPNSPILLAGMGPKSNVLYGYKDWDRNTVEELGKYTNRPILYRPKPSDKHPLTIEGATTVDSSLPLMAHLRGAHAVVTHHSNVGCDALLEGIPVFSRYGPARYMSNPLQMIEEPLYSERKPFFNRLAYCQWSLSEMSSGQAWDWLRNFHLGVAG